MLAMDYGPVPVSRLKEEASSIFAALEQGRRVLISRRGVVVAVINPASIDTHMLELAKYALAHAASNDELTASEIGQGSPSAFIKRAEEGRSSLLTRGNKVYGVLGPARSHDTLSQVRARARMLEDFERTHPDATPEEFARAGEIANLASTQRPTTVEPLLLEAGVLDETADLAKLVILHPEPDRHVLFVEASLDAALVKSQALAHLDRTEDAAQTLEVAVAKYGDETAGSVRRKAGHVMVELARFDAALMRYEDALVVADEALSRLEDTETVTG